jgi:hypothetical protein
MPNVGELAKRRKKRNAEKVPRGGKVVRVEEWRPPCGVEGKEEGK